MHSSVSIVGIIGNHLLRHWSFRWGDWLLIQRNIYQNDPFIHFFDKHFDKKWNFTRIDWDRLMSNLSLTPPVLASVMLNHRSTGSSFSKIMV